MGFVKVMPPPKSSCYCQKPSYGKNGLLFGVGTIWRCEKCGSAWKYDGEGSSYNESYSKWSRASEYDGKDNRPLPPVPRTEEESEVITTMPDTIW